jgi:hypothetical protein
MSQRSWLLLAALFAGLVSHRPAAAQAPATLPAVPQMPSGTTPTVVQPAPGPGAIVVPEGTPVYTIVNEPQVVRVAPVAAGESCNDSAKQPAARRHPLRDCYRYVRYGPSCDMPIGCAPCCSEMTFLFGSCCAYFGQGCGGCQGGPAGCGPCEVRAGKHLLHHGANGGKNGDCPDGNCGNSNGDKH